MENNTANQQDTVLKPMSFGDILDKSFKIFKNNFLTFAGVVSYIAVPLIIVIAVIIYFFFGFVFNMSMHPNQSVSPTNFIIIFICYFFLVLLFVTLYPFMHLAVIRAISKRYLGEKVEINKSYSFIKGNIIKISLTYFLQVFYTIIGYILFIIPGIILTFRYGLVSQVMCLEGIYYGNALKRSRELMKNNWLKYFVIGIFIYFIIYALMMIIEIPFMIILFGYMISLGIGKNPNPEHMIKFIGIIYVCLFTVMQAVQFFIGIPISLILFTLFYYDLRIKKEGFDLEMLSKSLEKKDPINNDGTGPIIP